MTVDPAWITLWQAVLTVGLGSFFLVVLIVMPLGARDIKRLFARLDASEEANESEEEGDERLDSP